MREGKGEGCVRGERGNGKESVNEKMGEIKKMNEWKEKRWEV